MPLLVSPFVDRIAARTGRRISDVPEQVTRALQAYSWPGNVRELENVIERASITAGDRLELGEWLPSRGQASGGAEPTSLEGVSVHSERRCRGLREAAGCSRLARGTDRSHDQQTRANPLRDGDRVQRCEHHGPGALTLGPSRSVHSTAPSNLTFRRVVGDWALRAMPTPGRLRDLKASVGRRCGDV